jgi:hypothetical protein
MIGRPLDGREYVGTALVEPALLPLVLVAPVLPLPRELPPLLTCEPPPEDAPLPRGTAVPYEPPDDPLLEDPPPDDPPLEPPDEPPLEPPDEPPLEPPELPPCVC